MADEPNVSKGETNSTPVCTFIKKTRRKQNSRKRKTSNSSSEDENTSAVVRLKRKSVANPMIQKTNTKKLGFGEADSNDEDDKIIADKDYSVTYKSTRSTGREDPVDMGATATIEIDTELDRDAQAIFERHLKANDDGKGVEDDKLYKGQSSYARYYDKKDTALGNAASGMVRQGPIRAPANLRSTIRWDYQPDICKDYKETGFCGFGDSCKFLHDRTDYKHGWQLERDVQEGAYGDADPHEYEIESDDDELPFACFICRETFKHPVVTKCKHYFCESCALAHYKKTTRCYVCSEQTGGVFNPAKDIIKRMKAAAEAEEENVIDNEAQQSDTVANSD